MPGSSPLYYWDTCLFLAWLKDEERPTGEMAGVREVIAKCKRRDAVMMTSVVTLTEVLSSQLPAGTDRLFTDLMQRVQLKSVDTKIARLAHDLRDWFWQRRAEYNNTPLSVPDALHLATAVLYKANEFHTFDRKNSRNSLGLLPLSGNVGGHKLVVCKPEAKHLELDLRRPKK
ncbi:MAG: PIN domain-containing protein [Aestuariivirga sp.]|uniref:type II toxin-antitoxin system VapC family toxin n=1 Tax=Aestuariivirga sp. TaxID=2650926 RepID=UPI00345B06F1|nr:PIN domain-containing protein [Aestuariivirga sp.]